MTWAVFAFYIKINKVTFKPVIFRNKQVLLVFVELIPSLLHTSLNTVQFCVSMVKIEETFFT